MENLEINSDFWRDRSVFLTGHTGFKGGWLALLLSYLGAKVNGYALEPIQIPNLFNQINLKDIVRSSVFGDIKKYEILFESMKNSKPSVVIHMAAQSLVRKSYKLPIDTYVTNVIGTANVLEASRGISSVEAILNITSDKCYENFETQKPYAENDKLGGLDPYSSSKACAELVSSAYQNSFFNDTKISIATARAGNVIGGGDWAEDRLVPDFFRAHVSNEILHIRSPNAVRPWQHVLEPLTGYLMLIEKLVTNGKDFSGAWNFGPNKSEEKTVLWMVNELEKLFPNTKWKFENDDQKMHESNLLKLDASKANIKLGWNPRWSLNTALNMTAEWYRKSKENNLMQNFCIEQIKSYLSS
jgi:CDP-glucose 4,6-dehydratase